MTYDAGIRFETLVSSDLAQRRREAILAGVAADKGEYASAAVVALPHEAVPLQVPFVKTVTV
jgi:hypothetical protein